MSETPKAGRFGASVEEIAMPVHVKPLQSGDTVLAMPPAIPTCQNRADGSTLPKIQRRKHQLPTKTFRNFLSKKAAFALHSDCRHAFTAQAAEDDTIYSAGSTFFIKADTKPSCMLEALAMKVFRFHTRGAKFDPRKSGAEWWTLCIDQRDDVSVHWDRDYGLEDQAGMLVCMCDLL